MKKYKLKGRQLEQAHIRGLWQIMLKSEPGNIKSDPNIKGKILSLQWVVCKNEKSA